MICKVKKFTYGLKQASCQWYYKFHQIVISFDFEINAIDDYIYYKFSGRKHIFLVLYVNNVQLANNNISLLHGIKRCLSKKFEMKDLGNIFLLGI